VGGFFFVFCLHPIVQNSQTHLPLIFLLVHFLSLHAEPKLKLAASSLLHASLLLIVHICALAVPLDLSGTFFAIGALSTLANMLKFGKRDDLLEHAGGECVFSCGLLSCYFA